MADCESKRFEMFQDDTSILNFIVQDENGDAVESIEDALDAIFVLINSQTDEEVLRLALDDGITLADNIVTVTIPKDNGLEPGEYVFELQLTDNDAAVYTLAQGSGRVSRRYIHD